MDEKNLDEKALEEKANKDFSNAKSYAFYADRAAGEIKSILYDSGSANQIVKLYVKGQIAVIREALDGIEKSLDLTNGQQKESGSASAKCTAAKESLFANVVNNYY